MTRLTLALTLALGALPALAEGPVRPAFDLTASAPEAADRACFSPDRRRFVACPQPGRPVR